MKRNAAERPPLPQGWVYKNIGDISQSIRPGFPSGKHNQTGLGIPHLRPMNISSDGNLNLNVVKYVESEKHEYLLKGDVLFNNTNSPDLVGKTTYIKNDTDFAYSNHMTRIRLLSDVFPAYVAYALLWLFWNGFFRLNCTNHVNQASINTGFLTKSVYIPIAPFPEQKCIVAKIEELFSQLDAAENTLKRARANLKRYRRSVLQAAVSGELTIESKYHRNNNDENVTKWEKVKLIDIGELNRGKSKHRPRNAGFLYGGPYPFIQTGDVKKANGIIKEYRQTYSEAGLSQSKIWPTGTLCITIAANIADTAILGFASCFPDSIVGFISNPEVCNTQYIEYFFRTAKNNLERYAPATAQKNINLSILSKLEIPLPPKSEQDRIVDMIDELFSNVDSLEKAISCSLSRISRLRQSILQRAFSGRLLDYSTTEDIPS